MSVPGANVSHSKSLERSFRQSTKWVEIAISARLRMIQSLQILRGFAAILVILAHVKFVIPIQAERLPLLLDGAGLACGVDLFFVLSGFVISMTAAKPGLRAGDFLMNRAIRVLPVFWLASLPYFYRCLAGGIAGGDISFRVLWNSIFLVPVLDKFGINDPVHPFGWTLSFEMWFYVLFALLLLFIPGRRVPLTLIGVFALGAVIPFVWTAGWKFPYFAFHPLCWEFAMGCGAYEITRRFRLAPRHAVSLFVVGIVLLGWGAATFEYLGWHGRIRMEPDLSALRALVWGVPSFLLVLACVWLEPLLRSGRLTDFGVALGSASYAIYLVQPLVFEALPRILTPFKAWGWPLTAALGLMLCVLAGWLAHRWVERPLLKWLRSFPARLRVGADVAS